MYYFVKSVVLERNPYQNVFLTFSNEKNELRGMNFPAKRTTHRLACDDDRRLARRPRSLLYPRSTLVLNYFVFVVVVVSLAVCRRCCQF